MTHLELENLASDYLEGQLTPDRRALVDAHLGECGSCRELMAGVRHAFELCHSAEDLEPAPWLISKIMLATVGARKPSRWEQILALVRPVLQPRVAYGLAMAVFSFSIIINAAGIRLSGFRLQDLNPRTWAYQANRNGHLFIGRAEKYYYDLKVVYEIESRLRQIRQQSGATPQDDTPKRQAPAGSSTDGTAADNSQLALAGGWSLLRSAIE